MNNYTIALAKDVAKKFNVEAFFTSQKPTDGSYTQNRVGFSLRYGFGGGKGKGAPLPDERSYRPELEQGDPYARRYYQDHQVSLQAMSGQMDSVRKIVEFVGSHVSYSPGPADAYTSTPQETYNGRTADCAGQSWLISKLFNDNASLSGGGNHAYVLNFFAPGVAHSVSLIDEGGKTFVVEYGRLYQIKVPAGASLETQAAAALRQAGPYLNMRPQAGQTVGYQVFGTDAPQGRYWGYYADPKTGTLSMDNFTPTADRAPVERGVDVKVGNGFD
jgi:hypothetical protein